jgi:uncharacterized membrane protein YcjF (UPF0283 family)
MNPDWAQLVERLGIPLAILVVQQVVMTKWVLLPLLAERREMRAELKTIYEREHQRNGELMTMHREFTSAAHELAAFQRRQRQTEAAQ